ncbi:MaoC family dehydratase [Actinacidiphila paucisporea]|uniref:Acyl dehydratase n=1 Tax=Actinacidiphila paucisporea TaxID=310782 RepID=A0A1M7PVK6_9ACTN|nr:MaoC/PaaZ C-terminal domain-containing protein [Actinacidiphila paucisporea]SHN21542.1 Acyl dehydratase [Actinacidiphila paucisporea]
MAPLLLTLARGAVTGLAKHPSPAAPLPPTRLTGTAVRVDPARVAAYARVCGFPPDGPDVPLTYPHILGFPLAARLMTDRAFPLPLLGLVHTSITIRTHGPLSLADRPDLTVHADGLRPHRRGTEVTMVTEARVDGALVWEDRSTYLARHRVPDQGPAGAATEAEPTAQLPVVDRWKLDGGLGRRHARVSGDYNPIHLWALTARPFGFPRAIVHGMWTVARCAARHPDATGVTADFRRPVLLPSTVEYAAEGDRFEVRSGAGPHVSGSVTRTVTAPGR